MIMKKFLFILTVIAGLFVSNAEARMKIRIPVGRFAIHLSVFLLCFRF